MKKSHKLLFGILSLALLLPFLLKTVALVVIIIVFASMTQNRVDTHAEWVRTTSQEEKNLLLAEEDLEKATGLDFPSFNVIDMWPPEGLTQDPCYYWELELKEDFDKDYFDGLVHNEKFIFNQNDSTYTLGGLVKDGEEGSELEIILKGKKVIIYDPFELKEEYSY